MKLKNTLGVRTSFRDRPVCECRDRVDAGASGSVKTFDHTVIVGRYNSIGDAVAAASKPPIKRRCLVYVVDQSDQGNSGNQRVTIALYKDNAPKADEQKNRVINGIVELPKDQAVQLEPYDTVTVQGFYRSQPEVNDAITKAARKKALTRFI